MTGEGDMGTGLCGCTGRQIVLLAATHLFCLAAGAGAYAAWERGTLGHAGPGANASLQYPRTVCEGFLGALDNNTPGWAEAFGTARLRERLQGWNRGVGKVDWAIESEALSADTGEASFGGQWTFEHGVRQKFVVTLVRRKEKDSDQDRWLVDGFSFSGGK